MVKRNGEGGINVENEAQLPQKLEQGFQKRSCHPQHSIEASISTFMPPSTFRFAIRELII